MSARKRRSSKSTTAEVVVDTAKGAEQKLKQSLTVIWDDLPIWQRDNHYILSGYRPASNSLIRSFTSIFYLHNESVNIYSHLIGAILFIGLGSFLYSSLDSRYGSATHTDVLAFGAFFLGAALCLGMSATYHCISNHSHIVARWGNKADYVGIVCLITGSFVPSVFYGFYCHSHLQQTYWTMICTLGLGCATVSIFDTFRTPAWRPYRAGMFVAMGLSAIFPVIHGVHIYGVQEMRGRIGLTWLVLQGALYILGAGLYATRWPERAAPGKFDIWGSSHQIFHVLVVLAACSHLWGLMRAFDFHHPPGGLKC